MSVILDCCEHWMEPINRGCSMAYVYNVLWRDETIGPPRDLPSFLSALKEVNESLNCWSSKANTPMKNRGTEEIIYFALESQYQSNLSFKNLQGNDRNMALTFLNCPFIDVKLAQVSHQVIKLQYEVSNGWGYDDSSRKKSEVDFEDSNFIDEEDYNDDDEDSEDEEDFGPDDDHRPIIKSKTIQRTEIVQWIDSNNRQLRLNLNLNWKKHHSGFGRNLLDVTTMKPVGRDLFNRGTCSLWKANGKVYHHTILVVWPKRQSSLIHLRYGIDDLLDRFEKSYQQAKSQGKEETVRLALIQDLQQIIATFTDPVLKQEKHSRNIKLITRLLHFCTMLKVRQEGLQALKILEIAAGKKHAVLANLIVYSNLDFFVLKFNRSAFSTEFELIHRDHRPIDCRIPMPNIW